MKHSKSFLMTAASVFYLGGCASLSSDGGFGAVATVAKERLGKDLKLERNEEDTRSIAAIVKVKLANPLNADDAVQVAMINNRGLRATYAELGIAEADLVQAGRLHNPGFSFKHTRQDGDVNIERTLTFNLIDLVTLPLASRMESQRFDQVKLQVSAEVLRVAEETRKAYFEAVAAEQAVAYARQVNLAAEAGAELANRMASAGNWSRLDQAREQTFHAEAITGMARADKAAIAAREKLTRLLGLPGTDRQFRLPDRLPDLPAQALEIQDAETFALQNRLDIQAAKQQNASISSALGLTKVTRFINALDLGYVHNTQTGKSTATGYEISIEIPLFDWGEARTAKAEAIYMQSVNQLAETAINARSQVRESYAGYRNAYDLARHYRDSIVPLRKKISDENMLRYNGMLISVFELLADAREQVKSVAGYIDALKDFWVAESDLRAALGGQLPATISTEGKQP